MLAGHVAELSDWGVSSLKIEGRMKRPEYAAIVTKVYSDLLREHRRPTAEERDILRRVFSRDGFTDGYYTGKLGDSMFGTKTDVPMNEVKKLYDEAAHRFAEGREAPARAGFALLYRPQGHRRGAQCGRCFGRHACGAGAEPPDHTGDDRKIAQKDRRHAVLY